MTALRENVAGETWWSFSRVVLGAWLCVWGCAALHNQYLIRIAPEHFTVWHYQIPFTQNHTLLGILYALAASSSPGVVLGMFLFLTGRLFERPKMPVGKMLSGIFVVWVAVEICAITAGLIVWRSGRGIYPDWVYPDDSPGLLITQTIQVTAYLSGAFCSVILLVWVWRTRGR